MANHIPESVLGNPYDQWELTIKSQPFKLKQLYIGLWRFLSDEDWKDMYTGGDKFETRFQQVNDVGGGRTYHIWWRAHRKPKNDAGGYYKYYLKINLITRNIGTKEVMHRDKKEELDYGEFIVKASLFIEENAENMRGYDNPLIKFFKKSFDTQVRGEIKDQVEQELDDFSKQLYKWFQINIGIYKESDSHDFFYAPQGLD